MAQQPWGRCLGFAQRERGHDVGEPAKRRMQQAGKVPAALHENALGMAHRAKALHAMAGPHAAGPDTAEGQVVLRHVHQGVVHAHVAGGGVREQLGAAAVLGAEVVERERAGPRIHVGDGFVDAAVSAHRQDRAEDFPLHQRRLVAWVGDQRGRQGALAPWHAGGALAQLDHAGATAACVLDEAGRSRLCAPAPPTLEKHRIQPDCKVKRFFALA
jgi:hypothetical protein